MNTILVFGISGVGKSWLCRQAAQSLAVRHISGSQLIQAEKERVTSQKVSTDALRTDRVVDNQRLLLEGFQNYRLNDNTSILFDGHNVIDTDNGLVEIPYEVISGLEPAAIVIVIDTPDTIMMRRASDPSRARPLRSVEALSTYQDLCLELAKRHASALSVPTIAIQSGDLDSFLSFLAHLV